MVFECYKGIGKFIKNNYILCLSLVGIGFGAGRARDYFEVRSYRERNEELYFKVKSHRERTGELKKIVRLSDLLLKEMEEVKELKDWLYKKAGREFNTGSGIQKKLVFDILNIDYKTEGQHVALVAVYQALNGNPVYLNILAGE